jgi:hemerythrin-like domain-containing protein
MNAMTTAAASKPQDRAPTVPAPDAFAPLDVCHRRILAVARELEQLVASLDADRVDAESRAVAAAIADFFCTVARRHHEDEERHVFPALLASGDEALVQAALRMQTDHGWLEEDWLELEPQLQAIATGIGQCDVDVLRTGVEVFVALYRDHIALEESLAYPEARARLGAPVLRAAGREMAQRRRAQRC